MSTNSITLENIPLLITEICVFSYKEDLKKLYVKVTSEYGVHETNPHKNDVIENNVIIKDILLPICSDTKIEFFIGDYPVSNR